MKETEIVIKDLNKQIAAPLPDSYRRRIIFWEDILKEFEDKLEDIVLENAVFLILTEENADAVNKLMCEDDLTSDFVVYTSCHGLIEKYKSVVDSESYCEEYKIFLEWIWVRELGIFLEVPVRRQVSFYRKFFALETMRNKIAALPDILDTVSGVHLAVMAVLSGCSNCMPASIIHAVLQAGLDKDKNSIYQNFIKYIANLAFWWLVQQATGFDGMKSEDLAGLDYYIKEELHGSIKFAAEDYKFMVI